MRVRRARLASRVKLIRGDIRHLPFPEKSFALVMAPYGILQSLLDEKLLAATLKDVRRVLTRNGTFGLELVADLPAWDEYSNRTSLRSKRGPNGKPIVADRIGQAGSPEAHHPVRAGIRRRARQERDAQEIHPRIPDAVGAPDGPAARKSRAGGVGGARRLPGRARGTCAPMSGLSWPGGGKITRSRSRQT